LKIKFLSFLKKKSSSNLKGINAPTLSLGAGAVVSIIVAILYLLGVFGGLESRTLDFWMRLRGPLKTTPAVQIIGVDDISLGAFGRWPWPRSYHATLLDILAEHKPKTVVFDVIFAEPTEDGFEEDEAFTKSIQKSGNIVLGSFVNPVKKKGEYRQVAVSNELKQSLMKDAIIPAGKSRKWFKGTDPTLPVKDFHEAALGGGFVNAVADLDGKIRRIPLVVDFNGELYPSLSMRALMAYWGIAKEDIEFEPGKWISLKKSDGSFYRIPIDQDGFTRVNYPGSFSVFPGYSFAQLMAAYYDEENPEAKDIFKTFRDSIVLVGITATGSTDLISTPFKALEPGIVMHAAILNNLIQGKFIQTLPVWIIIVLFLLIGVLLAHVIPRVSPVSALLIVLAGFIFYPVINYFLFVGLDWWLPVISVLCILIATYLLVVLIQFLAERLEKQILQQELSIAERIQMSFLPKKLPCAEGVTFAADTAMAKLVGGDLYDFITFEDETIGVAIGDVSGKGVPASLYMAKTISDFRTIARTLKDPAKVLTELNSTLVQEGAMGMFVTFFYFLLDLKKGLCQYSSAGHHPLMRWDHKNGEIVEYNTKKGRPLGILPFKDLDEGVIQVGDGDLLVLYTDGIDEAMNTARQTFGKERIKEIVKTHSCNPPKELIQILHSKIKDFIGKAPQHDDMTLIVARIHKKSANT